MNLAIATPDHDRPDRLAVPNAAPRGPRRHGAFR